jgi:uncharacterized protein
MNFHPCHLMFCSLFKVLLTLLVGAAPQSLQTISPSNSTSQIQRGLTDATEQYHFALDLLTHNPTPDEIQGALKWLRASAAQNNPHAEFYLGYLYEHGRYVSQDYALAFQYYQASALQHLPAGENNLAFLYLNGHGVHKNLDNAFKYFIASAEHGDSVGQFNLASAYYHGTGTRRNDAEAVRWLRVSAESGLAPAESSLGAFYFYGVGIQKDYTEAARLARLAAEQGYPPAETDLGFLYEHGKGVPLDYVYAYSWYSKAIQDGETSATDFRNRLSVIMTSKQIEAAKASTPVVRPPAQLSGPSSSSTFSLFGPSSHQR